MRFDGTLKSWNDDKGFDFIAPTQRGTDVFVRISAFACGSARPRIGEALSFEIERNAQGRPNALEVRRAGDVPARSWQTPVARQNHRAVGGELRSAATYFLKYCPVTQMDGNRDGVPCEQQWCTSPSRTDPFDLRLWLCRRAL